MVIDATILGGSGYTGGELLRLLLWHPKIDVHQITSRKLVGKYITNSHPNLRGHTNLKFKDKKELENSDIIFSCLPHGALMENIDDIIDLAPKIIDLSSDFRLSNSLIYKNWYGKDHSKPEFLKNFVYGIPELNRYKLQSANYVATAGCNSTVTIIPLIPFIKNDIQPINLIIDLKVPSSEGGKKYSKSSHHPERSRSLRSYRPTGHRHSAEIIDHLGIDPELVNFSVTTTDLVRGILATIHCWFEEDFVERDLWKLFRTNYKDEHFIRVIKERTGIHRYPDPKLLIGTNFCDVGFEVDQNTGRIVLISALDNLVKGAAGQAVHAANLMLNFEEITGLDFPGLHPL